MQDEKEIGGNKSESELCPVCMEKAVNMTLGCGHRFCALCVMRFTKPTQMQYDYGNPQYAFNVNLSTTCPICRGEVSQLDKNVASWRKWQDQNKKGGGGGGFGRGGSKVIK